MANSEHKGPEWTTRLSPIVFFEADLETLSLTYVSPNVRRILGVAPEDLQGDSQHWLTLVHPADQDGIFEALLAEGSADCRLRDGDGGHRPVRVVVRPHYDPDGNPVCLRGYLLDLSEAEQARLALHHGESVLLAVGRAARALLRAPKWDAVIGEILEMLAEAVGSSRAYLFAYAPDAGNVADGEIYSEWTAPDLRDWSGGFAADERDVGPSPRWRFVLATGESVSGPVAALPPFERPGLEARGVLSITALPVLSEDGLWGCLVLEDQRDEGGLPPGDLEALAGAADMLGAAIGREHSQARYRSLVETIPAATYIERLGDSYDPEYSWANDYMSPQIEAITGYPPDVWTDPRAWPQVVHPDDRDEIVAADRDSGHTGEPFGREFRVVRPDGSIVWLYDEATIVHDSSGRPLFWQGYTFDLTERKAAEERLRQAEIKYRTLVEQLPATVYIEQLDSSRDLYVSPTVEETLGFTQQEWLADPDLWLRQVHPDDRRWVDEADDRANETGEPFRAEYRMITKDGREVWVHNESQLVRDEDGQPRFWQGLILDVTKEKHAEEAIREALEREREIADRLRALDEMKSTFLNAVSHELRTPLTSVLGFTELLGRPDLELPPEARDYVSRLGKNARKLFQLLGDLLDLDRLTRGVLEPRRAPTDMASLINAVARDMDPADGRIRVDSEPLVAEVDGPKVERIVENLLANALKYSPGRSAVWVRMRREGPGVLITVEDLGPGVPDDQKQDIFLPFEHGSASETQPHAPGTGIGLALVAQFAQMHGGKSWVEDRPGGGSSFKVLLPGRVHDARGAAPAEEAAAADGDADAETG